LTVLPITGYLSDLPVLAAGTSSLIEWRKDRGVCSWLCGTLPQRRFSCYRHAAMLPCQAKTCRRLDRTQATNLVANYLKNTFKNRASYDAFAISAFRWVHSFSGWAWMTCVRFEDNGHPRAYAVFIKDGKVIDGRYAVQTDACNTQTYAVFDAMGPTRAGVLGPLY
jgi:hypothetical protein